MQEDEPQGAVEQPHVPPGTSAAPDVHMAEQPRTLERTRRAPSDRPEPPTGATPVGRTPHATPPLQALQGRVQPGTWLWTTWTAGGVCTVVYGLITELLVDDGHEHARVVYDDNSWGDCRRNSLASHRAHVLDAVAVPAASRLAVHRTLIAFRDGTYDCRGDGGRFHTLNVIGAPLTWPLQRWEAVGIPAIPSREEMGLQPLSPQVPRRPSARQAPHPLHLCPAPDSPDLRASATPGDPYTAPTTSTAHAARQATIAHQVDEPLPQTGTTGAPLREPPPPPPPRDVLALHLRQPPLPPPPPPPPPPPRHAPIVQSPTPQLPPIASASDVSHRPVTQATHSPRPRGRYDGPSMPDNPRAGQSQRNEGTVDGPGAAAAVNAAARRQHAAQPAASASATLASAAADSLRMPAGALPMAIRIGDHQAHTPPGTHAAHVHIGRQGIRLRTQNCSGLLSLAAVTTFVTEFQRSAVDIVALQDTRTTPATEGQLMLWLRQAEAVIRAPRHEVFWCHDSRLPAGHNGLAILVRPQVGISASNHRPSACGRAQLLDIQWGGHAFCLVNTYWPATGLSDRTLFLRSILSPMLQGPTVFVAQAWLCGDFNFVPDTNRDRSPSPPADSSTARGDATSTTHFTQLLPGHEDAYRCLHPTGKAFTFHNARRHARLDRVYLPTSVIPHLQEARVHFTPHGDHHAFDICVCALTGVTVPRPDRGRSRIPAGLPLDRLAAPMLRAWAQETVTHGLTLSHEALICWWPRMQLCYKRLARSAQAMQAQQRRTAAAAVEAARDALETAMLAITSSACSPLQTALQRAQEAQGALRDAAHAATASAIDNTRLAWIRNNERPSPVLTTLIRPPAASDGIHAIAGDDGTAITGALPIANALNSHFATVSGPAQVDQQAQADVLAALQQARHDGSVGTIHPDRAAAAGAATFTAEEVAHALAQAPSSSSPGPDGIPFTMWQLQLAVQGGRASRMQDGPRVWAPLLAHLFTGIATTGHLPPAFNLGTITPLPKPGQPNIPPPAGKRPITLLNSIYRIMAKVVANRFSDALAPAIGPEQSAFLPGRYIADNILLTSLVPHLCLALDVHGAVVFLDISKAFDTIDREFLYQCLLEMGASTGMVNLARLLLHDTRATTHVRGVDSTPRVWHSGVRQGCPLSPILYLIMAQALTSWLRVHPALGIHFSNVRLVSNQHADDTTIFLADLSPGTLATLTQALHTFAAASNQRANIPKSMALPTQPPNPPAPRHAASATTTTATPDGGAGNAGAADADPPHLSHLPPDTTSTDPAHQRQASDVHLPTTLPLPVPDTINGIPLVDHALSLGVSHTTPCPARDALAGPHAYTDRLRPRPLLGYDLVPTHPQQRQAWESRLAKVRCTLGTISRLHLSPMGRGLATAAYGVSQITYHLEFADAPDNFRQAVAEVTTTVRGCDIRPVDPRLLTGSPVVGGFGVMPLEEHVTARHLAHASTLLTCLLNGDTQQPGVASDNGTHPLPAAQMPHWVQAAVHQLRLAIPTLHPAQTLMAATLATPQDIGRGVLNVPHLLQAHALPPGPLTRMARALQKAGKLEDREGHLDADATRQLLTSPQPDARRLAAFLSRLGWRAALADRFICPAAAPISVKDGTRLLTRAHRAARYQAHLSFVRVALDHLTTAAEEEAMSQLRAAFAEAWSLPCPNHLKQTLWIMAINGVPGSSNPSWYCPHCHAQPHTQQSRINATLHCFWECTAAEAVRQEIDRVLAAWAPSHTRTSRRSLWLLDPPAITPPLNDAVWTAVCLAALEAMEHGRRHMWRLHHNPSPPLDVPVAGTLPRHSAVIRFWSNLLDLANTFTTLPPAWQDIGAQPFLRVQEGRLEVNTPP